ncbi:hypothetical protein C0638_01185 [Paenibacillus sp. lzh-N1]|uniref:hypothetical protein n=1 Tax=Paenibacillus sp. lzh-N1 TaxID=2069255 RepID=UPI000C80462B|nr:hypothetical protein [Paenibacillus sp. lzh-N1]AUO05280.1 hypothetical protein C0638_01185 [Paenibacillus sp. lzh-N1]
MKSLNQQTTVILLSFLLSVFGIFILIFPIFEKILFILSYAALLLFLIIQLLQIFYSRKFNKLPAKCQYNWFNRIEIHIGKKIKYRRDFIRQMHKVLVISKKRKAKVTAYTWLVSSKNIKNLLGDCATVTTPSPFEEFSQKFLNKIYRKVLKEKKNILLPFIKVEIDTNKITQNQLDDIALKYKL